MRVRLVLAVVALGLTAGCAGSGPRTTLQAGQYAPVPAVEQATLPPPQLADQFSESRPYRIGPFDKLSIEVFGVQDLTRQVQADAGGRISFPLVGTVEALGKTPQEVSEEIEARLRDRYVRNPQVTVNLVDTVSRMVTVDGAVGQPGVYPVLGRMTLMRAIATARGTSEFARTTHVLVFRRVEGQNMVGLYDLASIRQGLYEDPEIFADDVVVVDESRSRRIFRDILGVAPLLTAPLIAVLQNNN